MATEENRRWALDFVRALDPDHTRGEDPLVGTVYAAELLAQWIEGEPAAMTFPNGAMPAVCRAVPRQRPAS